MTTSSPDEPIKEKSANTEVGVHQVKPLLRDIVRLTRSVGQLKLRAYQQEVAATVVRSVILGSGLSLAVMFPDRAVKTNFRRRSKPIFFCC